MISKFFRYSIIGLVIVATVYFLLWPFIQTPIINYIIEKKLKSRSDFIPYEEAIKILNSGRVKSILVSHSGTYLELKDGTSRSTDSDDRDILEDVAKCEECKNVGISLE